MGCNNSKDGGDPDRATIHKEENFKPLTEDDKLRVAKVLEYWFND